MLSCIVLYEIYTDILDATPYVVRCSRVFWKTCPGTAGECDSANQGGNAAAAGKMTPCRPRCFLNQLRAEMRLFAADEVV
jgi:hypothetical protein